MIFGPLAGNKYTADVLVANNERFTFYRQAAGDGEYPRGRSVCQNGYSTYGEASSPGKISCGALTGEMYKSRSGGFGRGQNISIIASTRGRRGGLPGDSGATVGDGRTFMGVLKGAVPEDLETFTLSRIDKFPGGLSVVTAAP